MNATCPPSRRCNVPARSDLHNGGVNEPETVIRPVSDGDRPLLAWLVAELWGSEVVAVHGNLLRPGELPGFIAERARRVAGLLTYQLVGEDEADIRGGRISITSPIARALIGKVQGDIVEVTAPGKTRSYEIVSVKYV